MSNNTLNLDLENNEAMLLASPYQNMDDRKEIYLKYLIIAALKAKADIVDIQDSLFYSRKFYSLTRLFDFYVNNNVFDLIILKADSNEVLFDVVQDEIHSNIYGYAVARIGKDFKTAELLGYFLSKDFNKVVLGKNIKVSELTQINDFEDIEIMESQMSLEDVSERYFELLAGFMDNELNEFELAEFACLLYNSYELREVFSEVGRFDSLCIEMKENADLINDEFLSVFDGEMESEIKRKQVETKKESSSEDEYILDDLNSLVEVEPLILDTDEIDLSADLDELSENNIEESELLTENSEESLPTKNEDKASEMVSDIEEASFSLEELAIEDEPSLELLQDEEEQSQDLVVLNDEENDEQALEFENADTEAINLEENLEELKNNLEQEDELIQEDELPELIPEDIEMIFDEENKEETQEIELELESSPEEIEDLQTISENNDSFDIDLDLNDKELPIIEDFSLSLEEDISPIDEPITPVKKTNESKLAAELASLSLQENFDEISSDIDNVQNIQLPEPEPIDEPDSLELLETTDKNEFEIVEDFSITENETIKSENETMAFELNIENSNSFESESQPEEVLLENTEIINDELLELLSDDTPSDITVDDNEILSILSVNEENTSQNIVVNNIENLRESSEQEGEHQNLLYENNATNNVAVDNTQVSLEHAQAMLSQDCENKNDIQALYAQTNEQNTNITIEELLNKDRIPSVTKKSDKNKTAIMVAAIALLIIAGLSTTITSNKGTKLSTNTNKSIKAKSVKNDVLDETTDAIKSTPKKRVVEEELYEDDFEDNDLMSNNYVAQKDTKLETSLSEQAGAAPVILKSVAWQVPSSISKDAIFNKYLQIAGKNIKINLSTDLLDTDDFAYNNKIKISMTVKNNTPVKNIKIVESSGSKNVDDIVLQSIKQTLKYINTPVMSEDKGDREVVLVISI